jgi:hypothetical protein
LFLSAAATEPRPCVPVYAGVLGGCSGKLVVSYNFTWQADSASRRVSLRVGVVLACAALGILAGSIYPITQVMRAIERASLPRPATKATLPDAQVGDREALALAPGDSPPKSTEMKQEPEAGGRVTLLNPGSAEPPVAPQNQPATASPADRPGPEKQPLVPRARNADRKVLVVVRRRGPPYDTKVLQGRMRDGRLIVNARGLTIR